MPASGDTKARNSAVFGVGARLNDPPHPPYKKPLYRVAAKNVIPYIKFKIFEKPKIKLTWQKL